MIVLDGESVDFSDLFSENNGLHRVDDNPVDPAHEAHSFISFSAGFRPVAPETFSTGLKSGENEMEAFSGKAWPYSVTGNKKAGSGTGPLYRLPLHQPSVFPGYSSKSSNGNWFPEKLQKDFRSEINGQ